MTTLSSSAVVIHIMCPIVKLIFLKSLTKHRLMLISLHRMFETTSICFYASTETLSSWDRSTHKKTQTAWRPRCILFNVVPRWMRWRWLEFIEPPTEVITETRTIIFNSFSRSLAEVQPRRHLSDTIFKCHRQSQIIEDTVEPSCLSEKLI